MEECSTNSTVWIQHQNAPQPLRLLLAGRHPWPGLVRWNPVRQEQRQAAYCGQYAGRCPVPLPQWRSTAVLANEDRRRSWLPLGQQLRATLVGDCCVRGQRLLGVRVQNEGRTVAQGSRTLGGIGVLQIDIDNLLLGQGKHRQANVYRRLTLADNNISQSEYRVQMRTRLHHAIIEGSVTTHASETLVANFSLFVSANLSLPVVVLQCDRYDGRQSRTSLPATQPRPGGRRETIDGVRGPVCPIGSSLTTSIPMPMAHTWPLYLLQVGVMTVHMLVHFKCKHIAPMATRGI